MVVTGSESIMVPGSIPGLGNPFSKIKLSINRIQFQNCGRVIGIGVIDRRVISTGWVPLLLLSVTGVKLPMILVKN